MPSITTDQAVRDLFRGFDAFDGARQARDAGGLYGSENEAGLAAELFTDGRITRGDLEAVVELGEGGGYTAAHVEAARHLLADDALLDGLDAAAASGGNTDGRISDDDVIAFIDAHRAELDPDTVAIADAARTLEAGARGGRDDYDARLAAFAERLEVTAPQHRDALLREIIRQDGGAPASWLQRSRLEALASEGDQLPPAAYDALSALLPLAPTQLPDPPEDAFRTATYNIGQGASRGEGKGTDYDELPELARNIHDSRADVVTVQEIFEDDVETLRQELQAVEDQAAAREDRAPRTVYITFGNADGSKEIRHEDGRHTARGSGFGNAVITYAPQRTIHDERLPDDGDEGRALLGVETEVEGETVVVFTTHISSVGAPDGGAADDDRQTPQIREVFDVVDRHRGAGPVVLTGDFNVTFDGSRPSADVFGDVFQASGFADAGADAGATSNLGFGKRIDYVFSDGLQVGEAYVMDAGTSDHAAVVVDLRLPE